MSSSAAIGIDWFRISTSMALILVILAALFWILRRVKAIQSAGSQQRKLQVLETLSIGPRQKIALLRVGTREILVGISASQFTALANWDSTSLSSGTPDHNTGAAS